MCTADLEAHAQCEIFLLIVAREASTAWVGARRASAISLPCLSSLVLNFGTAASGFAFTLCNNAATVGVVLSNDPDAHIDCIGEMLCGIGLGGCGIELAR